MIKMNISVDFEAELQRIRDEVRKIENRTIVERTQFATESLKRVTPRKTGYAASRWKYDLEIDQNGVIIGTIDNDAPYIQYLNQGSSRQAPAYFIERTLIAIGEIDASTVDYLDD